MSTHRSKTPNSSENDRGTETDDPSSVERAVSTLARYGQNGTIAMLIGGILLVRGARPSTRNRIRAAAQVLLGAALLGLGYRQRRSDGGTLARDNDEPSGRDDDGEKNVSDDAHAARTRHDVTRQQGTNPRGVAGEPGEARATATDEGAIRFTEEGDEPRSTPSLDDDESRDPRQSDATDGSVAVDLSESAVADEAGEATGPDPVQAQPTRTEDTEPDPSPPEDASHVQADVPKGTDADSDANDGESNDEDEDEV